MLRCIRWYKEMIWNEAFGNSSRSNDSLRRRRIDERSKLSNSGFYRDINVVVPNGLLMFVQSLLTTYFDVQSILFETRITDLNLLFLSISTVPIVITVTTTRASVILSLSIDIFFFQSVIQSTTFVSFRFNAEYHWLSIRLCSSSILFSPPLLRQYLAHGRIIQSLNNVGQARTRNCP